MQENVYYSDEEIISSQLEEIQNEKKIRTEQNNENQYKPVLTKKDPKENFIGRVRINLINKDDKNTNYFQIKGQIILDKEKKIIEIKRRFKDFNFLNILLIDKFYYKVLPLLPQKNFLMKLITNKKSLKKRAFYLEKYLNKLLKIQDVKSFPILKSFLLEQDLFRLNYDSPEYKAILKKNNLVSDVGEKMINLFDYIKNKGKVKYDKGFYDDLSKEVDIIYIFLKGILVEFENIQSFQNEFVVNYNILNKLKDEEDHWNNYLGDKNFTFFVLKFKDIYQDVKSCQFSLINKDKIYKMFFNVEKFLKEGNYSENEIVMETEYKNLKEKIKKMNILLKEELKQMIFCINERIRILLYDQLPKVFPQIFKN